MNRRGSLLALLASPGLWALAMPVSVSAQPATLPVVASSAVARLPNPRISSQHFDKA
jgi:hypothetical protein